MLLVLEFTSTYACPDIVPGLREAVQIYLYRQSDCADVQGV